MPSALGDILGKPRGCEHACFSPAACCGLCWCSRTPLAPPASPAPPAELVAAAWSCASPGAGSCTGHLAQDGWRAWPVPWGPGKQPGTALPGAAGRVLGARCLDLGSGGEGFRGVCFTHPWGSCSNLQGSQSWQDPSLTCFGSRVPATRMENPHRGLCNHPWSSGLAPSTGEATGRAVLHNVGGGAPAETERRQQPDPGGAHAGSRERWAAVTSAAFRGFSYALAPRGVPGSPAAVSGAVSLASMRLFCPSAARRRCLGVGCGPTGDALRCERHGAAAGTFPSRCRGSADSKQAVRSSPWGFPALSRVIAKPRYPAREKIPAPCTPAPRGRPGGER